jgi:hypothetical protein
MGLGPHPPYRPPHRDDSETGRILYSDSDARARARTRNRKPRTRFRSSSAECSRARGGDAFALHHPPSEPLAALEDREQPGYGRRTGRRPPMELRPDSIRSSTSCRAIAARPAGNRRRMPRAGPKPYPGSTIPPRGPPSRERGRTCVPPDRPAFVGRPQTTASRRRWVHETDRFLATRLHAQREPARHGRRYRPLAQPAARG